MHHITRVLSNKLSVCGHRISCPSPPSCHQAARPWLRSAFALCRTRWCFLVGLSRMFPVRTNLFRISSFLQRCKHPRLPRNCRNQRRWCQSQTSSKQSSFLQSGTGKAAMALIALGWIPAVCIGILLSRWKPIYFSGGTMSALKRRRTLVKRTRTRSLAGRNLAGK